MKHKILLTTLLASTVLLQGCIHVSREAGYSSGFSNDPTVGQELMDLDKARASGAITGAEYDALKAKIIDEKE